MIKWKVSPHYFKDRTLHKEVRYNHEECGDTRKRLYVKFMGGKWLYHCHNCGQHSVEYCTMSTPKETRERYVSRSMEHNSCVATTDSITDSLRLPKDITNVIPKSGIDWLHKSGITAEECKQFGIVYSPRYNRLILPIFKDGELIYYQARNLGTVTKTSPKYLNIRAKGAKSIFFKRGNGLSGSVVVVEDILSAIKVGRYCDSIALLGSYIPDTLLTELVKYDKIILWLDYDKLSTAIKESRRLRTILGKPVTIVINKDDPKNTTDIKIKEKINEK